MIVHIKPGEILPVGLSKGNYYSCGKFYTLRLPLPFVWKEIDITRFFYCENEPEWGYCNLLVRVGRNWIEWRFGWSPFKNGTTIL